MVLAFSAEGLAAEAGCYKAGTCSAVFEMAETLSRVTDTQITISVLTTTDTDFIIAYGPSCDALDQATSVVNGTGGTRTDIVLTGLTPNAEYCYQLRCRRAEAPTDSVWYSRGSYTFHTRRPPGSSFQFALLTDTHSHRNYPSPPTGELDLTVENILSRDNDFLLFGGDGAMCDTLGSSNNRWMTGEIMTGQGTQRACEISYLGFLWSIRKLVRDLPIFLVDGNHESTICTDEGNYYWADPGAKSCVDWLAAREAILANPYSVLGGEEHGRYFSFDWGSLRFIGLDVTAFIPGLSLPQAASDYTLGATQRSWFEAQLVSGKAATLVWHHRMLGGFEYGSMVYWYARGGLATVDDSRTGDFVGEQKDNQESLEAVAPAIVVICHDHWQHFCEKLKSDGTPSGVHYINATRSGALGAAWLNCDPGEPACAKYLTGQDCNGDGIGDWKEEDTSVPDAGDTSPGYTQFTVTADQILIELIVTDTVDSDRNNTAVLFYSVPLL